MATKRTSYTQLPAVKELEEIMKKEAWRQPAKGKENIHFPKFDSVIVWLNLLKLDTGLFTADKTWQEVIVEGTELETDVVQRTLALEDMETVANDIYAYLGENDSPKTSDLIFVFGSQSTLRIQTAIDLWKSKMAPKILITGGSPIYKSNRDPEAVLFKKYALSHAVPEEAIIIEPDAISIADNVRRSINLFEAQKINYQKMILITAWFAMRRSWAFMSKYVPSDHSLYRVVAPVNPEGDFAKDRWWKNPNGIKVVFNEFVKMKTGLALNSC
ncbi:MAG: hypothetical protein G01um101416_139 [Microgenomates group bacterium Gr01-1014_16]|nr:MAG: hypothetical protein G01um101416_139 [Microgenomates group bacterium Gr01-1014_16]